VTTTYTPPAMHVRPLTEMEGWDDGADFSELSCAPVLGVIVNSFDCCSTEAWIVLGPTLGDHETLTVEVILAGQDWYGDPIRWDPVDSFEVVSLDEAVGAVGSLLDPSYRWGYRPCRSCEP
jgi:hypothetical protein